MATQTVSRGFSLAARRLTTTRSANVFSAESNRFMFQGSRAWFSSYPEHELVGLPTLSPVRSVTECEAVSKRLLSCSKGVKGRGNPPTYSCESDERMQF
jgi:hypothetical protein